MKRLALAAAAALATALPALARQADPTRDQELIERLKAESAAKAARIVELEKLHAENQAGLAKTLNEKNLAVAELQYSRQLAERISQDLSALETKYVQLSREKARLQEAPKKPVDPVRAGALHALTAVPRPSSATEKADEHYRLSEEFFQWRDFERAELECRKALETDPAHLAAHALLAEIQFARGNTAKKVPQDPRRVLDGKVTAVANEIGLVVLSIGKDDGVQEGDEFSVTRAGDFVARVQIDRTDRRWAAGKVVLKKAEPRVADDVSNHIYVSAPRPTEPLAKSSAEELRVLRKELDDVRAQVRSLSDRMVPSWQSPGVAFEDASPALRSHLAIARGVVLRNIREKSKAEGAGLQVNDVFPDSTEAQVLEAIEVGSPLKIIRRGQPMTLPSRKTP